MRKLNIFQVNGVWQLGRPDEVDKEDEEDLPFPEEHVQGDQPQPSISHDVNPNLDRDIKHPKKYDHHEVGYQYTVWTCSTRILTGLMKGRTN